MNSDSHIHDLSDEQLAQVTGGGAHNTAIIYEFVYAPQYISIANSNIDHSTIGGDTIYQISSINQFNQLLNMNNHPHHHHHHNHHDLDRD